LHYFAFSLVFVAALRKPLKAEGPLVILGWRGQLNDVLPFSFHLKAIDKSKELDNYCA
jgi:hypothetical protein